MLTSFIVLLVLGAIVGGWLHAFAVGFDMFVQDLIWDAPIGITISSRAGLAARNGKHLGAQIVNTIMLSKTHCQDAIAADILRANEALTILTAESPK
jgi:ABC-type spermidine/putrescine transport system permease subunit II